MTGPTARAAGLISALTSPLASAATVEAPAQAGTPVLPVQCEVGAETVLAWDDVAYDLRGQRRDRQAAPRR